MRVDRRQFPARGAAGAGALAWQLHGGSVARGGSVDRPNVRWVVSEDAPQLRADRALHYDLMTRMDAQVAERLAQLEEDGLADDTIVFYYGDHGGVMPRSKRSCLDSGLRIPLLVRFGARWAHLAPSTPGTAVTEVVDQLDLAPTVLALAGVTPSLYMSGRVLAGPSVGAPRRHSFGFRNRMDERYDMSRTVTDGRYRYTRNYMPHVPYGQHNQYAWQQLGMAEWERLYHEGGLDDVQSAYWRSKPAEELYDTREDPHEVVRLAGDGGAVLDELGALALPALDALREAEADPNLQVQHAASYTAAVLAGAWPYADGLSLHLPAAGFVPGEPARVIVRLHNTFEEARVHVRLALEPPDGWTAEPASPDSFAAVPPGSIVEAEFDVTAPAGAEGGSHRLGARATYDSGGRALSTTVSREAQTQPNVSPS